MPDHGSNGAVSRASGPAHAARGWTRTVRPLRIAMLGWARLSSQAWEGSGYNLSCSELARGLVLSGHDVSYLQSGMAYTLTLRAHVRRRERWGGVECYELVNAANLSPSAHNFRNVAREIAAPRDTRLVLEWLDRVRAELVHVHSLEGYGLDLIAAVRRSGRPVVVTPHNYWYVCPQVDLLHRERDLCRDYDGGRRCVGCLPAKPPSQARVKRALTQSLERNLGWYRADVVRKALYGIRPALAGLLRGAFLARADTPPFHPDTLSDPELARGFEGVPGSSPADAANEVMHSFPPAPEAAPRSEAPGTCALDENEQFLDAGHHLVVLNEYGRRRVAGLEALNEASLVTPPSEFLRRVLVTMGVREDRTRVVRLGQPHFDQLNRRVRRSPTYDAVPWRASDTRPLRFGFFGTVRPNKGLDVLLRAVESLEPTTRHRCHFAIYALGHDGDLRRRMSRYPEVAFHGGYDIVRLIAVQDEYDVGVLPHIWFENSPLVMLEFFHAGKFVISSRLGGPPGWVRDGQNGLLFPGAHPAGLADCIRRVVRGEVAIPTPRQVHEATELVSYPEHVRAFDAVYHELVAGPLAPGAAGRTPDRIGA